MAATTFGDLWRKVSLQASAVPPMLVRSYVQDAYQDATGGRRFSWMRRWYQPTTVASRTLAVVATQGSATLTGAFVASDLNRQVRATNQGVPYTIVAIDAGYTEATLDQAWAGTGGSLTVTISSAFLFLPENFDGCRTLSNLVVQQAMPWWYTSEQLDRWDPNRLWADSTARIIAARGVWTGGGTMDGRQVYEWWPYPSATAVYQMSYYAKLEPTDDDRLQGQFATRAEVLETGALAKCALYPGTAERKNPYFNLQLAQMLEKAFQESLQQISVRDEDTSPAEEYNRVDWRWVQGIVPMDTHLLRSTDASLGDYWGGGSGVGYGY
jgi:hypothetical protein